MRPRRLVASLALAGALLGSATAARASSLPGAPYGLVASNANGVPGTTLASRTAAYRRLYDAGVRAIRVDLNWTQVAAPGGAPDRYDFAGRDREVQAITQAGLKVIGILAYGHPGASRLGGLVGQTPLSGGLPPFGVGSAQYFPPDDPTQFTRYASAVVRRYRSSVIGWEVWNEENEGWRFWPPREDPAAYARLLCATHHAVKALDPGTPVVFGGVFFPAVAGLPGTSGPDFVAQAYDAHPGLGHCYDVLAYHPYPYPFTAPELDVPVRGSVLGAADAMRAVLRAHGDVRKPLWITEVGWPTSSRGYGVSEAKQAQYVARMQAATFAQGVPVLTWYTYGDDADPTGANQEAAFGFFRADGTPKPSYAALHTFARVFAGTRFHADLSRSLGLPPGQLDVGGRGFALRYSGARHDVTALWLAPESAAEAQGPLPPGGTAGPATITVRLPVRGRTITVVDYLGASRRVAVTGGHVTLVVGAGPRYVVEAHASVTPRRRRRARPPRRRTTRHQAHPPPAGALERRRAPALHRLTSHSSSAFCAWRRFSACSQMRWRGP